MLVYDDTHRVKCAYTCTVAHMWSQVICLCVYVYLCVQWHTCRIRCASTCMMAHTRSHVGVHACVWLHTHGVRRQCKGTGSLYPSHGSQLLNLSCQGQVEDKSFWCIFHPNLPILRLKEWLFLTKYFNTYFVDLSWSCEHLSTVKIPLKGNREYHTWHSEHIVWDLATTTYFNFNIAVISAEGI